MIEEETPALKEKASNSIMNQGKNNGKKI